MNVWDLLLGSVIAVLVALALRSIWQTKRQGGCASCPYADGCGRRDASDCTAQRD